MVLTIVKTRYFIIHGLFRSNMSEGNNNIQVQNYVTAGQDVEFRKMSHRKDMAKERHSHEMQMQQLRDNKDLNIFKNELGWIGRFFGGEKNSSKNITAALNILLIAGATIISLIVYFDKGDTGFIKALWSGITPIVSLSLGYLFGKK